MPCCRLATWLAPFAFAALHYFVKRVGIIGGYPVIHLAKPEFGEPMASGIFRPQSGRKIVGRGKSASALTAPAGT